MKLLFKIIGVVVALLVVAVIGLVVVAHFVITPERVRARVIPLAEKALHRNVELKGIDISIFSGISLKGFEIAEADGKTPFVSADAAILKYKLMPLLHGRVEVDEIGLSHPKVRVVRMPDGSFNFSDLIPSGNREKNKKPRESVPAGKKEKSGLALLVSRAAVIGGDIEFIDRAAPGIKPFRLHLTGLEVRADSISLNKPFPFTCKADLNGKHLTLDGRVNPAKSAVNAKVKLAGFPVTDFKSYFEKSLPAKLNSADLSVDISLAADPSRVFSSGVIRLENINLILDSMPDAGIKSVAVALDYNVAVNLKKSSVAIKKASVDANGIKIDANGVVNDYDKTPVVDMTVTFPSTGFPDVLKALPQGIKAKVAELSVKGKFSAEARISGPVSAPEKLLDRAMITLDHVSAKIGGLEPAVTGKITAEKDSVSTGGLEIALGKDKLLLDVEAKNLMKRPIIVKAGVASDHIDVDALLAAVGKKSPALPEKEEEIKKKPFGSQQKVEIGPFDIPVTADGRIDIAHLLYNGLDVSGVRIVCRLEKNVLYIKDLAAGLADGMVTGNGRIDLAQKGLVYEMNLDAKGVRAEPFMAAFVPYAENTIFGTIDLNTHVAGRGTDMDAIRKSLLLNGDITVTDGRVTGQGLAAGLSGFFNTEKLKVIDFKKFAGNVKIVNGKAAIDSDLSGKDVRMRPKGTIGLDGGLDLALDLRLSPGLAKKIDKKGSVSKFLSDNTGWRLVPLKIGGTLSAPSFSLDTAAVKQQVKKKAVRMIEDKIQKKLFKNNLPKTEEKSGQGKDGKETEDSKKLIDNALKGLFGK